MLVCFFPNFWFSLSLLFALGVHWVFHAYRSNWRRSKFRSLAYLSRNVLPQVGFSNSLPASWHPHAQHFWDLLCWCDWRHSAAFWRLPPCVCPLACPCASRCASESGWCAWVPHRASSLLRPSPLRRAVRVTQSPEGEEECDESLAPVFVLPSVLLHFAMAFRWTFSGTLLVCRIHLLFCFITFGCDFLSLFVSFFFFLSFILSFVFLSSLFLLQKLFCACGWSQSHHASLSTFLFFFFFLFGGCFLLGWMFISPSFEFFLSLSFSSPSFWRVFCEHATKRHFFLVKEDLRLSVCCWVESINLCLAWAEMQVSCRGGQKSSVGGGGTAAPTLAAQQARLFFFRLGRRAMACGLVRLRYKCCWLGVRLDRPDNPETCCLGSFLFLFFFFFLPSYGRTTQGWFGHCDSLFSRDHFNPIDTEAVVLFYVADATQS